MKKLFSHENRAIIDEILSKERRDELHCRGCGEKMDAAFRICWNCGKANDEEDQ